MSPRRKVVLGGAGALIALAGWRLGVWIIGRERRQRPSENVPNMHNHPLVSATLELPRSSSSWIASLTLRNTSNEKEASLVRYNLPIDGALENNVFEFKSERGRVAYKGRYVKRDEPGPADYITLPAGATVKYEVDLARFYELPDSTALTVWYEAFHVAPGAPLRLSLIQSNAIDVLEDV